MLFAPVQIDTPLHRQICTGPVLARYCTVPMVRRAPAPISESQIIGPVR